MWVSCLCLCQWFLKLVARHHHLGMLFGMRTPNINFLPPCLPKSDALALWWDQGTCNFSKLYNWELTAAVGNPFQLHSCPLFLVTLMEGDIVVWGCFLVAAGLIKPLLLATSFSSLILSLFWSASLHLSNKWPSLISLTQGLLWEAQTKSSDF